MKHQKILQHIRDATLPMTLKFQPRSFANEPERQDPEQQDEDEVPKVLKFSGGPQRLDERVNGVFELVSSQINDKHVWQRKDQLEDPILVWFNPAAADQGCKDLKEDLWMISRASQVDTQNAYGCVQVPGTSTVPSDAQ